MAMEKAYNKSMAPIVRVEKSIFPKLLIILIFLIHFQRLAERGKLQGDGFSLNFGKDGFDRR